MTSYSWMVAVAILQQVHMADSLLFRHLPSRHSHSFDRRVAPFLKMSDSMCGMCLAAVLTG